MNRIEIIDYLFKKLNYSEDQRQLIESIEEAKEELEIARQYFNAAAEPQLIDYAIYREDAAKARLSYLIRKAKEKGVQVEASLLLDEIQAV